MLINTIFLEDSFLIKRQSREDFRFFLWIERRHCSIVGFDVFAAASFFLRQDPIAGAFLLEIMLYPDFATCFILTIEKNVENTAFGLYFFTFMI